MHQTLSDDLYWGCSVLLETIILIIRDCFFVVVLISYLLMPYHDILTIITLSRVFYFAFYDEKNLAFFIPRRTSFRACLSPVPPRSHCSQRGQGTKRVTCTKRSSVIIIIVLRNRLNFLVCGLWTYPLWCFVRNETTENQKARLKYNLTELTMGFHRRQFQWAINR